MRYLIVAILLTGCAKRDPQPTPPPRMIPVVTQTAVASFDSDCALRVMCWNEGGRNCMMYQRCDQAWSVEYGPVEIRWIERY